MKIDDVYYEKHTVVGVSKRTGTVSETDVERVNMLPIEVLDKIKVDIEKHVIPCSKEALSMKLDMLQIIDKYKAESMR